MSRRLRVVIRGGFGFLGAFERKTLLHSTDKDTLTPSNKWRYNELPGGEAEAGGSRTKEAQGD